MLNLSANTIGVTVLGPETTVARGDSVYSNYAEMYEEWDESPTVTCTECKGTGLDRDEIYDCLTCFGEGVIVDSQVSGVDKALQR